MNDKIISMDFDGTLLTSNKKVTDRTKKILLKYKNNNYYIVGATARNLESVCSVCDISMFDYLILNNGAYIYDVKKSEALNVKKLTVETIEKVTDFFKCIAERIDYCSLNKYYIYKEKAEEYRKWHIPINNIDEINETVVRMNIFLKDSILTYKNYIEKMFDDIDVIIMSDTDNNNYKKWLALNPKGVNKLATLKNLCQKINVKLDNVIFFGDGANDLEIIRQVGKGIAMGNALEEIKAQAKETTLSNDEEGIAVYLEKFT